MQSRWVEGLRSWIGQILFSAKDTDADTSMTARARRADGEPELSAKELGLIIRRHLTAPERRLFELRIQGCTEESLCRLLGLTPQTLALMGRSLTDKFRSILHREDLKINEKTRRELLRIVRQDVTIRRDSIARNRLEYSSTEPRL